MKIACSADNYSYMRNRALECDKPPIYEAKFKFRNESNYYCNEHAQSLKRYHQLCLVYDVEWVLLNHKFASML